MNSLLDHRADSDVPSEHARHENTALAELRLDADISLRICRGGS